MLKSIVGCGFLRIKDVKKLQCACNKTMQSKLLELPGFHCPGQMIFDFSSVTERSRAEKLDHWLNKKKIVIIKLCIHQLDDNSCVLGEDIFCQQHGVQKLTIIDSFNYIPFKLQLPFIQDISNTLTELHLFEVPLGITTLALIRDLNLTVLCLVHCKNASFGSLLKEVLSRWTALRVLQFQSLFEYLGDKHKGRHYEDLKRVIHANKELRIIRLSHDIQEECGVKRLRKENSALMSTVSFRKPFDYDGRKNMNVRYSHKETHDNTFEISDDEEGGYAKKSRHTLKRKRE